MATKTATTEEHKERMAEREAENESLQNQLDAITDIVVPSDNNWRIRIPTSF